MSLNSSISTVPLLTIGRRTLGYYLISKKRIVIMGMPEFLLSGRLTTTIRIKNIVKGIWLQ